MQTSRRYTASAFNDEDMTRTRIALTLAGSLIAGRLRRLALQRLRMLAKTNPAGAALELYRLLTKTQPVRCGKPLRTRSRARGPTG